MNQIEAIRVVENLIDLAVDSYYESISPDDDNAYDYLDLTFNENDTNIDKNSRLISVISDKIVCILSNYLKEFNKNVMKLPIIDEDYYYSIKDFVSFFKKLDFEIERYLLNFSVEKHHYFENNDNKILIDLSKFNVEDLFILYRNDYPDTFTVTYIKNDNVYLLSSNNYIKNLWTFDEKYKIYNIPTFFSANNIEQNISLTIANFSSIIKLADIIELSGLESDKFSYIVNNKLFEKSLKNDLEKLENFLISSKISGKETKSCVNQMENIEFNDDFLLYSKQKPNNSFKIVMKKIVNYINENNLNNDISSAKKTTMKEICDYLNKEFSSFSDFEKITILKGLNSVKQNMADQIKSIQAEYENALIPIDEGNDHFSEYSQISYRSFSPTSTNSKKTTSSKNNVLLGGANDINYGNNSPNSTSLFKASQETKDEDEDRCKTPINNVVNNFNINININDNKGIVSLTNDNSLANNKGTVSLVNNSHNTNLHHNNSGLKRTVFKLPNKQLPQISDKKDNTCYRGNNSKYIAQNLKTNNFRTGRSKLPDLQLSNGK